MNKVILLFPNGNTVVCINGEQVPELEESWLALFLQFLESKGYNPAEFEINLPSFGSTATAFKTSEGNWNWTVTYK